MQDNVLYNLEKYFREKKEVTEMSSVMEKWRDEFLAEGRAEGVIEVAKNMLKLGLPMQDIAASTKISLDEIKKIQAQMAN